MSKSNKKYEILINFMRDKHKWSEKMKIEIPYSFERYGDHLLFSEPAFAHDNWSDVGEELWKLVCKLYQGKVIAVKGSIRKDDYRTPQVRLLYGDSTKVIFIDNHIKYTWDIMKNMFSSGNVNERHRIAKLNCEGEVIVDLFAGIGYFTLPYLVHTKAEFVHACEWNRTAVEALRRNLIINGVAERCRIYEGDNRLVAPRNIANRVNVGLIPTSEDYWQVGCESLLATGGILYIHENVTSKFNKTNCDVCKQALFLYKIDFTEKMQRILECGIENNDFVWKNLEDRYVNCKKVEWFLFAIHVTHSVSSILNSSHSNSLKVSVREIFKVKSYAPHIDHIVFTVHCYSV